MHTVKIVALVLGAIILTIGSTLVTIAALWGAFKEWDTEWQ